MVLFLHENQLQIFGCGFYPGIEMRKCPWEFSTVDKSDSKVAKTYVRPDNTFILTCPHCGHQKIIPVDSCRGYKRDLKVRCVCQNIFVVNLEFRKFVRKKKLLRGTYSNHTQNGSSGKFIIQDISLSGMAFTCLEVKNFKTGDMLSVTFSLDDEYQTEIKKKVIVRSVRFNSIGCEFQGSEESFGSPLGYYVMNKL